MLYFSSLQSDKLNLRGQHMDAQVFWDVAFVLLPVGSPGFLRFLRPKSITGWLGLDVG